MSGEAWIDQELLYLNQVRALFKVCGAADRLLNCLGEFGLEYHYCSKCFEDLETALAAVEAARFYDRAKGKMG